jgi:hypothetical protein
MTQPAADPYREGGGDAPGLPFPRKRLVGWTALIALLGVIAVVGPAALLNGGLPRIMRNIYEGGGSMWLLLLLEVACPILVVVLGARAIRGRTTPIAAAGGVALLPALVAFAGTLHQHAHVVDVLGSEPFDSALKLRIAFEGVSEEEASLQLGALVCAFALVAAGAAATGVLASIDRARVGARGGTTWLLSAGISFASTIAAFAYVVATKSIGSAATVFLFSIAASLGVAVLAAFATSSAAALRGWHDPVEARRVSSAIVVAALACALALFLFDRAIVVAERRLVFAAAAGESVDASQRGRILYEWLFTSRAYSVVSTIHVVGTLAAFVPALARATGKGTRPLSASAIAAAIATTIVAIAFVALPAQHVGLIRQTAKLAQEEGPLPVRVPAVDDVDRLRGNSSEVVVLRKDEHVRLGAFRNRTIAADRALAVRDLHDAVQMLGAPRSPNDDESFALLVESTSPGDWTPRVRDPELADMLGSNRHAVHGVFEIDPSIPQRAVRVRIDGPDSLFVANRDGQTMAIDLDPGFDTRVRSFAQIYSSSTSDDVYVIVRWDTSIDSLARVLAAVESGWNKPHVIVSQ